MTTDEQRTPAEAVASGRNISPAQPPDRWTLRLLLWLVAIIGTTQAVGIFLPQVFRPDFFVDDARQHIWWTYRFADPGLYPNDFIADFFSRPIFAPYGFQAIYKIFAPWIDAQKVSELVPLVLSLPVVALGWLIGRRAARGHVAGGLIAVLFIATGVLPDLRGGFPRSFAPLILLLGIWALMARRQGWLGVAFLLAAFFYPQAGINLGLLAGVVLGLRFLQERRLPQGWVLLAILGSVAMLLVGSVYARHAPKEIGPKLTRAEGKTMPELSSEGRSRFFDNDKIAFYIEGKRSGLGFERHKFLLFLAILIAGSLWRRDAVPMEAWALLGTSLVAFMLAHAVLFTLHLPNRFISYTSNIFFMMFLAGFCASVWKWFCAQRFSGAITRLLQRHGVQAVLAGMIGVGFCIGCVVHCHAQLVRPVNRDQEAAFAFLETLPKATKVAAHPVDASDIPLRTRRSVIASQEIALPYYVGYYKKVSDAIRGELTACYASDWKDVEPLNTKFGADVFFVYIGRYHNAKGNAYVAPFRDQVLKDMERGQHEGFVLEHPPADRILFAQGEYLIVSLKPKN